MTKKIAIFGELNTRRVPSGIGSGFGRVRVSQIPEIPVRVPDFRVPAPSLDKTNVVLTSESAFFFARYNQAINTFSAEGVIAMMEL